MRSRPKPAPVADPATTLPGAITALERAVYREPGDRTAVADLRQRSWHCARLAAAAADLAAVLAIDAGALTDRPLIEDTHTRTPGSRAATACRELAATRRALESAAATARSAYTELSHLHPATPPKERQ